MVKRPSNSTHLRNDKGWLRIEWQFQGKRYYLYPKLKDTKTNRAKLRPLQVEIEADLESGAFDVSLAKYKPDPETSKRIADWSSCELFERWLKHKSSHVSQRTLEWYQLTLNNLRQFFDDKPARAIASEQAHEFLGWLRNQPIGQETQSRRIEAITACWEWAVKSHYLLENPWSGLAKLIKTGKAEKPEPFTVDEIQRIIEAFKIHPHYSQLAPFVRFLFGTGCRTGEAIGLRWENVAADCSSVVIAEQLTKGQRKPTKGLKIRTVRLSSSLQKMMQDLRRERRTDLVFAWNDRPINLINFRRRAWKPILESLGIAYRKVYSTRHTFISHVLEQGMNPVAIAQLTGHDPKVLFDHYAGLLSKPKLPDMF